MIALDDQWVDDFFGGDLNAARMSAESQIDNTIAALNNPGKPFAYFFKLTFKKIFFPNFVGGPDMTPGSTYKEFAQKVKDFYEDKYNCVPFDCLIYFTSASGTDLSNGVPGVVITPGNDIPSMAHEIGHTLGLTHLNSSCCNITNTIMCAPPKAAAAISPLNTACNFGVPEVNTALFTPSRCSALAYLSEEFEADFVCPPTGSYGISIAQSNPNPVFNCKSDGDINTVSFTLFNGHSQQKDVSLRAFIGSSFASSLEFVQDANLDFNCINTEPTKTEFRITEPNCGDETLIPICAGCSITVKFKVRYLGGLPSGSISFPITVYSGNIPFLSKTFQVMPFKSIPSGNLSGLLLGPNPLLINGTLLMDNTTPFDFGSTKLLFATGAALVIKNGSTVIMPHVIAEGCTNMWKGITVREGGTLNMNMMTTIKDAQIAVNVQKGGTANIQSCKFIDNNYAIRTDNSAGTGDFNITALGNEFSTSENGLKPAWGSGQQPAPGVKGFAGIYVSDFGAGLNIDKDATFGMANKFTNLHYGIFAENTNVTVRDAIFTDIVKETRPVGYDGPFFTGSSIYLNGGNADVKGNFTGIVPDPLIMDNCYTGVNVFKGAISVAGCEMGHMTNGIIAGGGANKAYTVSWNNITASDQGISVFYQSGLPGQSSIDNNTVHMAGNPNGIGIANGGQEMFPQQEGFVANNIVTVEEGATGIQIGVANRIKVTQNFVNLTGSGTLFGIKMEGGDRNVLNCNSVQSAGGNNDGIYAVHAGRASVLCNTTNGPARGLHFEGMLSGRNKADIAGNTMENNSAAGLLLGTDAVVGGQVQRGNKFEGTEAIAGIGAQIHSQFAVDANENPDFLPDAWLPFPWFLNAALPSLSFDCGANTTCPPPPGPTSEYPLDIKIVKGELGGTSYQAANQWLSQRRFYELVAEEGNPYPGNSDVSTFLSQSQTNGLSGYANVQIGIRQLGALSEGARATAAASLLAMNGNLTGSAPYQVNEKTVNNVFLQTVALDNPIFTPAQTALLTSVATQCPLSGGEAVLRARALLNLNFETPIVYNDAICNGQRPSGERNETGIAKGVTLKIYPNPASDRLNLEYSKLENTGDIQLALYDTFGRVVREVALTNKEGKVQLDVQTLPEGIYWYVLPGILTGKVILQH